MLKLQDPVLNHVMSRDARKTRDQVLDLCMQHGGITTKSLAAPQQFRLDIIKQYDPIHWERAVLYAHPNDIWDAVRRATSKRYHDSQDPNKATMPWKRGSITGTRYKKTDWLAVARLEPEWWVGGVQFPRSSSAIKNLGDFAKIEAPFRRLYDAFIKWVPSDFSYKALFTIFAMSTNENPDFIIECMGFVEDPRKRSIEYLTSVVDRERAIRKQELMEREDITEQSKAIISAITSAVEKREPIDWDSMDEAVKQSSENRQAFDKVKLS